jgi:ethanolamine-phosphate phospho-lyase
MEIAIAATVSLYFIIRGSSARVQRVDSGEPVRDGAGAESSAYEGPSKASLLADRASVLGYNMELNYAKSPLLIVRGRGAYLYDEAGVEYLDGVNNVAHVGHSHPAVLAAVRRQYDELMTNSRYVHPHIVTYAKRLLARFPAPLSVVFWVNSGSEANDLALRLAAAHTRRRGVIAVDGAYHGHTGAIIDISPYKFERQGGRGPRGHVRCVPQPDCDSGLFRGDASDPARAAELAAAYAATVDAALAGFAADEAAEAAWRAATGAGRASASRAAADAAAAAARPADAAAAATAWAARVTCDDGLRAGAGAFIMESILSCGGQVLPPAGYLGRVYRAVRAAGGVCIADEVQVGFGRVGSPHFWAFQLAGPDAVPDIVTLGKPIGNGFPVAAVVTTADIARSFASSGMDYFNTFAGSPVAGAVAHAVLDVIEREDLPGNAARVGAALKKGLLAIAAEHPQLVGSVRGAGLMLGLEVVKSKATKEPDAESAAAIKYKMLSRRILISTDGESHATVTLLRSC